MKDFLKEAIEKGEAIDAYANSDEVRKFIENKIGYMRQVFNDTDKNIDEFVNIFRKQGVCYWQDMDMTLFRFEMANLPKYLNLLLDNFRKEVEDIKAKVSDDR